MMTFLCILVAWLFTLCLHEFAHAFVAYHGGDTTVKEKGYLTLNPLAYTDIRTSIVFPLIVMAIGGIALPGGAVYIERDRLRSPVWDSAVSLAGPSANLIAASILSIPFALKLHSASTFWAGYAFFVYIQVFAALLNLLPLPPLDGFGVIEPWLSWRLRLKLRPVRSFGFYIIFLLLWLPNPLGGAFIAVTVWLTAGVLRVPVPLIMEGFGNFHILGGL